MWPHSESTEDETEEETEEEEQATGKAWTRPLTGTRSSILPVCNEKHTHTKKVVICINFKLKFSGNTKFTCMVMESSPGLGR
jgi:hypothetical protein